MKLCLSKSEHTVRTSAYVSCRPNNPLALRLEIGFRMDANRRMMLMTSISSIMMGGVPMSTGSKFSGRTELRSRYKY